MSADVLKLLRDEIALLGPVSPSRRYPPELKERILTWVRARLAAGEVLRDVASNLGVPSETLSKWLGAGSATASAATIAESPGFRPVRVVPASRLGTRPTFTVRSPRGYSIEGLDFLALIELLRRLG